MQRPDFFFDAYEQYLRRVRRYSEHTSEAYLRDLEGLQQFSEKIGIASAKELLGVHVRQWVAHLMESGVSARSVHRKISAVRSWSKYARKQGWLTQDPTARVVLPKMPKRLTEAIPFKDIEEMFRHFPWEEWPEGNKHRAILMTLYLTGMRSAELLGLKEGDVDLEGMQIRVTGKRNKQRLIPMHPALKEALKVYELGVRRGRVAYFEKEEGEGWNRMQLYKMVQRYLKMFSDSLKTSPHVLRHSFATHLLNGGANLMSIKEILGHSSLSATQVYTKNSFEKLKKMHKLLHPRK